MDDLIKIVYAVDITGSESIAWQEGATPLSTTLPAGTYWGHSDATLTDYPSLHLAVASAMTAEAAASGSSLIYTVSANTPTESVEQLANSGLAISASGAFTFRPSVSTINALGVLGWPQSGPDVPSVGGVVRSPYTYRGAWVAPVEASRWMSYQRRLIEPSTEVHERADAYFFDRGRRDVRGLEWEFVYPGHVREARAINAAYAANSELAQGDVNNAFESAWAQGARGRAWLVVYYADPGDLDGDVTSWPYEISRMSDARQMSDLLQCIDEMRAGGEIYRIRVTTVRIAGTWRGSS